MKRQLKVSVMLVALTVVGLLNLGTVDVSAVEPAGHIYISPAFVNAAGCSEIGSNYTFSICSNYTGTDVIGYAFKLTYDPTVLHGVNASITNGDVITNTTMWNTDGFNNTKGELGLTGNKFFYLTPPPPTVNGTGILAYVNFTVVGCGISNIDFVNDDETRLIGWDGSEEVVIIDRYLPETGRLVGAVFDHSASHDVAVIDVSLNQTVLTQGSDLGINVTAENQGGFSETFTVTVYANTTLIHTENVIGLAVGASTNFTATWDTTGALGSYTIKANASIVAGETDTADNTYVDGTVTVQLPGAVDITNVTVTKGGNLVNASYKTWTLVVNVTIHNNGSVSTGYTVSAYYYNATVTQQIVISQHVDNLDPCNTTNVIFTWSLLPVPVGFNYTVKANATCDLGGAGDEFVDGLMKKRPWGDINDSGHVSLADVGKLDLVYSGFPQGPNIDPYCDISGDCSVSLSDVGKLDLIYSGFPPPFP